MGPVYFWAWRTLAARASLLPHALFILGTVIIPLYLLVSLAYTVVSTLDYAQYLALSRKTLLLIAVFILAALLDVPLYFVVSLVYTVVRKVR